MATTKFDFKKQFKDLYTPPKKPVLIDVPEMNFIMVEGKGDPNASDGEYDHAVQLLYALSYTIKMSHKSGRQPEGFFEYVVPPLEGFWWMGNSFADLDLTKKENFSWIMMIRQPEFVTEEVFQWACEEVKRKKPELDASLAYFDRLSEGLCVQMMHIGPYDDEARTVSQMEAFIKEQNLRNAIGSLLADGKMRHHHEIYLSDPRKTAPEKLKTVIRVPVE